MLAALALASFPALAGAPPAAGGMQGFSAAGAAAEAALERRFDAALSADEQRAWLEQLSSAPNHVGSAHDKANAEFILARLREWGWDAAIETFSVLYPTPRELLLEMVSPQHFRAALSEPAVPGDRTSTQSAAELPAYNVYGADGDVTADLIYVNRGMPDDYDELEREGGSVRGRIVLVRYGGGWRGLKPKLAFEHGAVGCLIYSDPQDDGFGAGDTYPRGGYRPADGVQRGSVADIVTYPGDPLTPGVGAVPDAARLAIGDAPSIQKIPVLPISYAAAEPLLAALGGRVAPPTWRGGLPLAYHVGPGPARVHLRIRSDWNQQPLYDVIARLRGAEEPDRWIIRGNHHDAWVFGATDPLSGQVALLAEAKAIGALAKTGWRPRRTLIYASWDGEEPGLLGSTEWAETHAAELQAKAALYINSDMNGRGIFRAGGSRALQRFVSQAARDVRDPETGATVLARALAAASLAPGSTAAVQGDGGDLQLEALGSGSDFSPFLQHLGIAALDLEFGGEADYGVYHSAYDSFDHHRRFVDPAMAYGVSLAQTAGRVALRAAQAELIPQSAGDFAQSIAAYADELHKLCERLRAAARTTNDAIDRGDFALVSDPTRPRAAPRREAEVPYLDFAALDNAVVRLLAGASAFDRLYARASDAAPGARGARDRDRLNALLTTLERSLTDAGGLPGRVWYRHQIYAPGTLTGYGAKTLPGIREAIEQHRWEEANRYVGVVAKALGAYAAQLEAALAAQ
jgi:N-acetylated-alpha-linked acidic dipeptidase